MGFSAPSLRQLSFIGALLAVVSVWTITYSSYRTNWSALVYDKSDNESIVDIKSILVPRNIPISNAELESVIAGNLEIPSIHIDAINFSRFSSETNLGSFASQYQEKLKENGLPIRGMENHKYFIFFEVDRLIVEKLNRPHIFFHRIAEKEWKVHINGTLVKKGDSKDQFVAIELPDDQLSAKIKVLIEVTARHNDRLAGIYFTYGLTIRSATETAWALQNLPAQHQYPRILATVFLFVFSLVGFAMACSTPKYGDIWGYSAFCGSLAALVWKETPFFWSAFEWDANGGSNTYAAVWIIFTLVFMVTTITLNLTFFRIRGTLFRGVLIGIIGSSIWIFYRNNPAWNPNLKIYLAWAEVGKSVVVLLLFSQIVIAAIGFTDLFSTLRKASASGITPRAAKISRRIGYAIVFSFGIGIMQYFYLSGLVKQSTTPGPDLFLLAGIVPAGLILLLFSWTIGAADRERLKLAPTMEVIDELLLEHGDRAIFETTKNGKQIFDQYGHPIKKEYVGVLAWFDLKGFTMTDGLRRIDERHRVEIDKFFTDVDMDLSDLYHNLFPRFRFKWAGDELSWAYFAKNKADADAMVAKAFNIWCLNAARLTAKWKSDLIKRLGSHMDPSVIEAMDYVDVHVAFTRLDELKIKPGLFESKADYESSSYTRISRAFKKSSHLQVAVFEETGLAIVSGLPSDMLGSIQWIPALSAERHDELQTLLAKDPSNIKKMNEELMLAGTGFLVFESNAKKADSSVAA